MQDSGNESLYEISDIDSNIDGVDSGHSSERNETGLHAAVEQNDIDEVKKNIERGLDINDKNIEGMTALHLGVKDNCAEIVKILLRHGAQPEIRDTHGNTSLHLAFKNYRKAMARLLLENGSDICAQDTIGDTVFHFAIEKNRKNFVQLLLEKIDDNSNELKFRNVKDCLSVPNNSGQTPTALVEDKYRKNSKCWETIYNDIVEASIPIRGSKRNFRDDSDASSEITNAPPNKKAKIADKFDGTSSCKQSAIRKTLHGVIFQTKLTMLLIRMANDKEYEFYLGSEVYAAGDFDDIVIRYKSNDNNWKLRFFQAKHRINPKDARITINDLKTIQIDPKKKTKDDFSLLKYFKSFCKIIEEPLFMGDEIEDVVIITNTDFDFDEKPVKYKKDGTITKKCREQNEESAKWKRYFAEQFTSEDEFLFIKDPVETHVFKEEFYDDIIEEIKALDKKGIEPTMENVDEKIRKFLQKLVFVTNYPSETKLDSLITSKLGEDFELFNANFVKNSYLNDIINFMKEYDKGRAKFYTHTEGKILYERLKGQINTLVIFGLSEAFKTENIVNEFKFNVGKRGEASNFNSTEAVDPTVQKMHNFLFSNEKHILHLKTKCTKLSTTKVFKLLKTDNFKKDFYYLNFRIGGYMFTDAQKFLKLKLLFQSSFLTNEGPPLLVLVCPLKYYQSESENYEFQEILNFCRNLMEHEGRKAILIDQSEFNPSNVAVQLRTRSVAFIEDEISFKYLTKDLQSKMFEKNVNIQGNSLQLKNLLSVKEPSKIFDSAGILLYLMTEKEFKIGNNEPFIAVTFSRLRDYYIDRNFHCQWVKNEILKENVRNELFFITGASHTEFNKLSVENELIHPWVDGKTYSNGIVFSPITSSDNQDQDMYTKLCIHHRRKCVYWLECRDVNPTPTEKKKGRPVKSLRLYWRAITGNDPFTGNVVHKYVENHIDRSDTELNESRLTENTQKVIIIANDAGFGKTRLLTSLAEKIKKPKNGIPPWIVRIDLHKYSKDSSNPTLKNVNFESNTTAKCTKSAQHFVLNVAVPDEKNEFERKIFKASMQHYKSDDSQTEVYPRLVILFDGFDEISPTLKTKTTNMIKALKNTDIAQIFITTRNSEKTHLENELSSPSFTLDALSESDQIKFLTRLWPLKLKSPNQLVKSGLRPSIPERPKSTRLRRNTIDVDESLNSKNNIKFYQFAKQFIEIANNIDKSCKRDNSNNYSLNEIPLYLQMMAELVHQTNFEIEAVAKMTDIVMYEKIIKAKFDLSKKKTCEELNVNGTRAINDAFNGYHKLHRILAMKEIFPEVQMSRSQELSVEEERDGLVKVGFLLSNLEFYHRTFAEYFVGEYLANNLDEENSLRILENVLSNRMHANICKFFEHNLKEENYERMKIILKDIIVRKCANEETKQMASVIAHDIFHNFQRFPKNFQMEIDKNFVRFAVVKIPKDKPIVIEHELVTFETNEISSQISNQMRDYAFYKNTYKRGIPREIECYSPPI